ncbi:MAG TPA: hypothetical protein VGC76_14185 [Pyrinomonadaceae bacterium]|jgi:hypothetical protein
MNVILFDMGLPMIFPAMFMMLIALLPVVFLEAYNLRSALNITFGKASAVSSLANIISTVVGIPLTWLLLVLLQFMTGGDRTYGIDSFWQKLLAVTWQSP